jgi:hypothetical protein
MSCAHKASTDKPQLQRSEAAKRCAAASTDARGGEAAKHCASAVSLARRLPDRDAAYAVSTDAGHVRGGTAALSCAAAQDRIRRTEATLSGGASNRTTASRCGAGFLQGLPSSVRRSQRPRRGRANPREVAMSRRHERVPHLCAAPNSHASIELTHARSQ